ncbi:MAG: hypothetical protein F6K19_06035 [Cyanothece sp. SIO1E1]|nr:hypothetical protein [Cyanothece sp. SIO1E1]
MNNVGINNVGINHRETRNPLIRDGVAQQQRQMPALDPKHVLVDEKDLADFLVFAQQLSQRVTYYNLQNQADGNWHAFFERSTPVQIAQISKTRPESIRDAYEEALGYFLAQWAIAPAASPASASTRLTKLEGVLDVYAQLLDTLRTWYQGLANGTPLKATIKATVKTNLPQPLRRLYRLEQGVVQRRQVCPRNRWLTYQQLANAFHRNVIPAPDHRVVAGVRGDRTLALDMRQLITNRVQAQAELDGIFQPLFQTYLHIIQLAPAALQQSLYADQRLDPHLALYVAFWQVLKLAQADLNRMTQRHLDFFYRQVLRLVERPAQPDKAHIILELERFQQAYKLARQTRFSAGSDATGVDLFYTLDEDIVVNTAQVVELKGIFLHGRATQETSTNHLDRELLGLHVSPVANSFDGKGGAFPKDQTIQAWLPFGDATRPAAALGLAIAANIFLLGEGDRTITFKITLNLPSVLAQTALDRLNQNLRQELHIDFSGEAGWISGNISSLVLSQNIATEYVLTVVVKLPVDIDPVVSYHAELPGAKLATTRPVARLVLRHGDTQHEQNGHSEPSAYHYLHEAQLKAIAITTQVQGVRNLLLQNDLAILDATKPFQPFGPQPKVGTSFYIGSQEVFQKHLTHLQLRFELETEPPRHQGAAEINWQEIYAAYGIINNQVDGTESPFNPGQLTIHALRERQWHPSTSAVTGNLFSTRVTENPPQYHIDLTASLANLQLQSFVDSADTTPLAPWTHQSQYGFLRSQLTGDDFRHSDYPTVLARQVLATATQETIQVEGQEGNKRKAVIGAYYQAAAATPSPEETPANASDSLTRDTPANADAPASPARIFQAKTHYVELDDVPILPGEPYTPTIKSLQLDYTATATQENCQLFHLYPFNGVAALPPPPVESSSTASSTLFLPQFEHEGELLIGLQNLEPATSLSLLFQVAEETADTNLEKIDVVWHYLKDNTWQQLEDHLILKDTSNGLIHSGIVKLAIPEDISNTHTTILNPALRWIKAMVPCRSRAICHIISIHTQAAAVTFADAGNDPNYLATPLPAESITQLADPQPQIKQIQQPYASFGGQVKEQPTHFYTRISEHLRHKGRAVTIFDYERLVLDRFPEIYKVRCINHGRMAADGYLHEIEPGHVTLAVIPTLSQRRTINDLQPRVNINLLAEIERYLKSLSSHWAQIRVVNPRYEQLWVEFRVQFRDPFQADFAFYQRQLEREIIGFLSPWTIDGGAEIHFGGEIYLSSILNFVEERTYVDYVLDFEMYQQGQVESLFKATASTAQSILVSVAPFAAEGRRHVIQPVPDTLASNRDPTVKRLGYTPLEKLLQ